MQELAEGLRLAGRYTLIRKLGAGGMAAVWLAQDAKTDGRVALKFLDATANPAAKKRFHEEWRIGSRLMHAHIARVFEFHDDDAAPSPFYSLQYIDGVSIAAISGQALDQLMRPFGLLADALRYAHGKGIVHGDITATNVLLDPRGAPCLIDFGVAVDAGISAGSGGGTPAALSPQRIAGEAATAADDMYSFGVLMHELLFAEPPATDGLPSTTTSGETLPGALAKLLQDLLSADASGRPSAELTASRLADAGFPPGAATLRRATAATEAIDVQVRSIRPATSATATSPKPAASRGGIPVTAVVTGLVVLLGAFLAVLFWLPPDSGRGTDVDQAGDTMTDRDGSSAEGVPAAGNTSSDGAQQPVASDDDSASFSENRAPGGAGSAAQVKAATDEALGDLLSRLERLRYRGIERWGGQPYLDAMDRYATGDQAYVNRNYAAAGDHYRAVIRMLDPFFDRINDEFNAAMQAGRAAFERQDHREAIRYYDLAVAITPGNPQAEQGLARARSLEAVLQLMERGTSLEKNLEFDAARQAYSNVLELDAAWQPAKDGLLRVDRALEQLSFEQRMTEGFNALGANNLDSAQAAFEAAKGMRPSSDQPVDGLLQVDQARRLARIQALEASAAQHEQNEQWEAAVETYRDALSVDSDLQFAKDGLQRASQRAAIHNQLQTYIENPDSLSQPQTMQQATRMLLDLSRIDPTGPRLADQKEALARLLKRAATPLPVQLVSDNETEVTIFRVGELGSFGQRQLELRPGTYVAMGSRAGYRDVRLEFRVAPEIEMKPIVVQCEERI